VHLAGLCAEKLKGLQHGGDIPPLPVTADIAGELAVELQAPLLVTGDKSWQTDPHPRLNSISRPQAAARACRVVKSASST